MLILYPDGMARAVMGGCMRPLATAERVEGSSALVWNNLSNSHANRALLDAGWMPETLKS